MYGQYSTQRPVSKAKPVVEPNEYQRSASEIGGEQQYTARVTGISHLVHVVISTGHYFIQWNVMQHFYSLFTLLLC